ncbi:hypothetical protein PSAC2689_20527 [Paraburkholderia sacchari]
MRRRAPGARPAQSAAGKPGRTRDKRVAVEASGGQTIADGHTGTQAWAAHTWARHAGPGIVLKTAVTTTAPCTRGACDGERYGGSFEMGQHQAQEGGC